MDHDITPSPRDPRQCALPSKAPSRDNIKARAPPQSAPDPMQFSRAVDGTYRQDGDPTPSSLTSSGYKSNTRSDGSSIYELTAPYNNAAYPIGGEATKNTTHLRKSMTSHFSARKSTPPTATSHPAARVAFSNYQQHNVGGGLQQAFFPRINDENNPKDIMNVMNIKQQRQQQEKQQLQQPLDSFTLDSLNSSEESSLSIDEGGMALLRPHDRWGSIDILKETEQHRSRPTSPLSAGRIAIDDDHSSITSSSPIVSLTNYGYPSQIGPLQGMPPPTIAAPPVQYVHGQHISTAPDVGKNASPSTTEAGTLHSRLRSLEIQHENLLSANKDLASQLKLDRVRIDSLEFSEEEARQEAALWEARWRDDFGKYTGSCDKGSLSLLEQLRGALLQKSKEEYGVMKHQLVALTSKFEKAAESHEFLMAENEALREELRQGAVGGGDTNAVDWERRALDSEKDLMKRKGELHQLTKVKQDLEERLNQLLESSEKGKKEFESIKMKLEQQLKDEREVHQAKLKQIATDAAQMIEDQTNSKGTELFSRTQENMVLKEENQAVHAENEKLAKRVVDLERKINASLSDASELRKSLLDAETAIPKLETERNELREKMRKLESDYSSNFKMVGALSEENEKLKLRVPSLEERMTIAQDENKALKRENDEVKSKLCVIEKENKQIKSNYLTVQERLNKELETIKALEHTDRDISKENSVLRSSIAGLEHKLITVEASLSEEREKVARAERARDQAAEKVEQFEGQVKSLEYDISTANQFSAKKRDEYLQLQDNVKVLKNNISTLREEISSAAIARSQLELELKQREDECSLLRRQLDPMEKEKYRLELDNASLIEEVESLKKSMASNDYLGITDLENEGPDYFVKKLEEKNRFLTNYIETLQKDVATMQLSQHEVEPTGNDSPVIEDDVVCVDKSLLPVAMLQQLNDARAAAKKTASLLKEQLVGGIVDASSNPSQTSTVVPNDLKQFKQSGTNTPRQHSPGHSSLSTTPVVSPEQTHNSIHSESKDARDQDANMWMQLEEKHSAEKNVLKTKFRGRLRRMKRDWDKERQAILSLVAGNSSVEVDTKGRQTLLITTPANYVQQVNVDCKNPSTIGDELQSIASSYDETEAFVMNILNGIEVYR